MFKLKIGPLRQRRQLLLLPLCAIYNHWAGLVDWAGGLDWWSDTTIHFDMCVEVFLNLHAWQLQAVNDSTLASVCYTVFIPALTQP